MGTGEGFLIKYYLFVLLGLVAAPVFSADPCVPPGYTISSLLQIKQSGFVVENDRQRNALAIALLGCLANPNPALRDGMAYEGVATWLRSGSLGAETIDVLYESLSRQITGAADTHGFQQPFAALLLSEVARTDRIEPAFTLERRAELVALAADYLQGVRDYRGFSETEGWRHGVAHGSDLVLQLVLNPNIDAGQIQHLMAAVAVQVAPAGEVFYHYGEPERLARAVFYAWRRGVVENAAWLEWFESLSAGDWGASFSSQAGLARRHNTLAFLLVMHLNATAAGDAADEALDKIVMQAISRVLGG
jgi:hypothetical protein